MKLGPIQTLWLEQLEKHPERQMSKSLGFGDARNYKACCLGELLICKSRIKKLKFPFFDGELLDGDYFRGGSPELELENSWQELGLRGSSGALKLQFKGHDCLADANDNEMTWPEIAKFIRENPDAVFTKSV